MGPGDTERAAARLEGLIRRTDDPAQLRALALALLEAARSAALTDKTPDYGYGRRDRDRDRRGELPGPGAAWNTPREIIGQALQDLTRDLPA